MKKNFKKNTVKRNEMEAEAMNKKFNNNAVKCNEMEAEAMNNKFNNNAVKCNEMEVKAMNKKFNNNAAQKGTKYAVIAKEAYETKVGLEALARAGQCPQLKGVVHEVMYKDAYNAANALAGKSAQLTKSSTAMMKDIVIMKGNKVAGHAQLKDTVSASGVLKTVKQINSGHYGKTQVLGTVETAAKIQGKTRQAVHSSGISSETTARIAGKALGKMPSTSALHTAGKAGGVAGAAISAGIESVSSLYQVYKGDKTLGEAAGDITIAAVKGGVTGYAGATAAPLAAAATGSAIAATGVGSLVAGSAIGVASVAAAPVVVGFAAACAVSSFISSLFD